MSDLRGAALLAEARQPNAMTVDLVNQQHE